MKEYAFQGYVSGVPKYRANSYKTLAAARSAAKEWIGKSADKTADLMMLEPLADGHKFGATWAVVGSVTWAAELQAAADLEIALWKGDHHARNDAQALRLQVAEQHRDNWSATQ